MSTQPTPAPTGGSNYDQIGAALASPEPSQAETVSTDTPPETTGTPVEPDKPADTPSDQPAAQPADQTQPDAETNPYEVDEGEDVAPQTLNTLLASDRGRQIYQSFKTLREFAKPIDQGGIGHVPTTQQIRDYYSTYRDRVVMDNDLNSGDAQSAERLLGFLFNPQRGEGPQNVAQQLAPTLAKLNPETYAAAAQPFITNYAGALFERYQQAKEAGDEKLRSALWYAANVANYDMTGQWLKDGPPAGQAPNGQADPLALRRAELDQREQAITHQQQQAYQQQLAQWNQANNTRIGAAVGTELDKALAPLKTTSAPGQYRAMKREFHDTVVQLANRPSHALDLYMVKVKEAKQNPNIDLAQEYLKLVTPAIKATRKQFLEEAGVTLKQQSDARHAELRQVDQHSGLSNGSGGPAPLTTTPIAKKPGETARDFNLRQLMS